MWSSLTTSDATKASELTYNIAINTLSDIKSRGVKVIILMASPSWNKNLYLAAGALNMLTDEFVFMGNYSPTQIVPYHWRGFIGFTLFSVTSSAENDYLAQEYAKVYSNDTNSFYYSPCGSKLCNSFARFCYDDVLSFGYAIKSAIESNEDPADPNVLRKHLRNVDFLGSTLSSVAFDSNQDGVIHIVFFIETEGRINMPTSIQSNQYLYIANYNASIDSITLNANVSFPLGSSQEGSFKYGDFDDGSDPNANYSLIVGNSLSVAIVNVNNSFILRVYNSFNELTSFNDLSSLSIMTVEKNSNLKRAVEFNQVSKGHYNVFYSFETVGMYILTASIKGSNVIGSPFLISVVRSCKKTDGTVYMSPICSESLPLITAGADEFVGKVGFVMGAISFISCFLGTILIWNFRDGKIIKAGSPLCLIFIGFGLCIWSLTPILFTLAKTQSFDFPCFIPIIAFHIGIFT